jgi:hypothetical protein
MSDTDTRGAAGVGLIAALEALAEGGSGWCDEATFAHLMAVCIAAERRRQAWEVFVQVARVHQSPSTEAAQAYERFQQACRDEDAALAALKSPPDHHQQRGAIVMRATSEQVDDMLSWTGSPLVRAICRDWLDMATERERMLAVVQAVEAAGPWPVITYRQGTYRCVFCDAPCEDRHAMQHFGKCAGLRIANALASLTPARDETAVG